MLQKNRQKTLFHIVWETKTPFFAFMKLESQFFRGHNFQPQQFETQSFLDIYIKLHSHGS